MLKALHISTLSSYALSSTVDPANKSLLERAVKICHVFEKKCKNVKVSSFLDVLRTCKKLDVFLKTWKTFRKCSYNKPLLAGDVF